MASNVTEKSPSTTCKNCSNPYTDPRMLPCLHSFCTTCIESLIVQDGSKKTIRCPMCETTSHIPEKGIEAIPQNVRLSYEAEVATYEAKIKGTVPTDCEACNRIPSEQAVAFCCTCREFQCKPCHDYHLMYKKTANHIALIIDEAKDHDVSAQLKENMPPGPLHCQEHTSAEVKLYCTTCKTLVCIQCTVIQHAGHKFEEINNFAEKQKVDLDQSAQSLCNATTKLDEAVANGKVMIEKVGARKLLVNDMIQNTIQELHKALDKRGKALLAQSSKITASKLTSLQLQMEEMASLRDEIDSCCAAISEAQRSHTDTQLLSVVMVLQTRLQELMKKFSVTTLQLREDDTVSANLDTASLVSEMSMFGSIKKRQARNYKSLSKPVMTISGINAPYNVAVHDDGDIFVTSFSDHCIRVFDKNGRKKAKIGSHGSGDGQFNSPLGIATSGDVVFVAENGGNRIQKLSITGEFLMKFGTQGSGNGQLYRPWGMCLSSNGNLYVTELSNRRVQVFNPDGTFSNIIKGQGANILKGPEAVAFDPSGNLHVADRSSKSIKVFTAGGNYVRQYGSKHLKGQVGVAVDQDGYCLVGDWDGKSLCVFDPRGHFVHSVPTPGTPCGVALDKEGFVYVVDYSNYCVYKY